MPTSSKKRYTVHVFYCLGSLSRVPMVARSFRWRWTAFLYAILQAPLDCVSDLEDNETGEYRVYWV